MQKHNKHSISSGFFPQFHVKTYEVEKIGVAIFEAGPVRLGHRMAHDGFILLEFENLNFQKGVATRDGPRVHDHKWRLSKGEM